MCSSKAWRSVPHKKLCRHLQLLMIMKKSTCTPNNTYAWVNPPICRPQECFPVPQFPKAGTPGYVSVCSSGVLLPENVEPVQAWQGAKQAHGGKWIHLKLSKLGDNIRTTAHRWVAKMGWRLVAAVAASKLSVYLGCCPHWKVCPTANVVRNGQCQNQWLKDFADFTVRSVQCWDHPWKSALQLSKASEKLRFSRLLRKILSCMYSIV